MIAAKPKNSKQIMAIADNVAPSTLQRPLACPPRTRAYKPRDDFWRDVPRWQLSALILDNPT